MPYVIRDGKLEKAQKVVNLTVAQKAVLRVSTSKQADKLRILKAKMQDSQAS